MAIEVIKMRKIISFLLLIISIHCYATYYWVNESGELIKATDETQDLSPLIEVTVPPPSGKAIWDSNNQQWIPYEPSNDERIDKSFTPSDKDRVIFEALFELTNRVRALEGSGSITRSQLKDWLKDKLP